MLQTRKFRANVGGHAPQCLREGLLDYIGGRSAEYWNQASIKKLIGQLWNCTDVVPRDWVEEFRVVPGSTYAQGVRRLARFG
jgi:hypothetical protein